MRRATAPRADQAAIARVHPDDYIEAIRAAARSKAAARWRHGDGAGTSEAALRAAGGVVAVDAVMAAARTAFAPSARPAITPRRDTRWASASSTTPRSPRATPRPRMVPGASRSWTSTSITATARRTSSGRSDRLLRLDPPDSALSRHRRGGERGDHGKIVNVPAGRRQRARRSAWPGERDPAAARRFAPELVIISAGFDAHRRDPLGKLSLVEADFGWATGS